MLRNLAGALFHILGLQLTTYECLHIDDVRCSRQENRCKFRLREDELQKLENKIRDLVYESRASESLIIYQKYGMLSSFLINLLRRIGLSENGCVKYATVLMKPHHAIYVQVDERYIKLSLNNGPLKILFDEYVNINYVAPPRFSQLMENFPCLRESASFQLVRNPHDPQLFRAVRQLNGNEIPRETLQSMAKSDTRFKRTRANHVIDADPDDFLRPVKIAKKAIEVIYID